MWWPIELNCERPGSSKATRRSKANFSESKPRFAAFIHPVVWEDEWKSVDFESRRDAAVDVGEEFDEATDEPAHYSRQRQFFNDGPLVSPHGSITTSWHADSSGAA